MSFFSGFNPRRSFPPPPSGGRTEVMRVPNALQRILSFTGHTIDDVINDPLARQKVVQYYKLHRWLRREHEIRDLERQWNPLGRR